MSEKITRFADSLDNLESEVGLEGLAQILANSLLCCSARLVGDATNNWSVKTDFVSGEVVASTDKTLKN